MTQEGQKNRDFSQIRLGTVVGFDAPVQRPWYPAGRYTATSQSTCGAMAGWQISSDLDYGRWLGDVLWGDEGGYIISQPEADPAEPVRTREEQRRKDAEGQRPVAWQRFSPCKQQRIDVGEDYLDHYRKMRQAIRCLYSSPTNVAALDAGTALHDVVAERERQKSVEGREVDPIFQTGA